MQLQEACDLFPEISLAELVTLRLVRHAEGPAAGAEVANLDVPQEFADGQAEGALSKEVGNVLEQKRVLVLEAVSCNHPTGGLSFEEWRTHRSPSRARIDGAKEPSGR
ncbi:hypothetical protein D9M69_733000 [compost metagenome]